MSEQIEPTEKEYKEMEARVERVHTLRGRELADAFTREAKNVADAEFLGMHIKARLVQLMSQGDSEAFEILQKEHEVLQAQSRLQAAETDGKVH